MATPTFDRFPGGDPSDAVPTGCAAPPILFEQRDTKTLTYEGWGSDEMGNLPEMARPSLLT